MHSQYTFKPVSCGRQKLSARGFKVPEKYSDCNINGYYSSFWVLMTRVPVRV